MSSLPVSLVEQIHARAMALAGQYRRAETELVDVLQKAEEHRVYLRRGHTSLFTYVTRELGIAESAAYTLITVAHKAREVPALKAKLQAGKMSLTNARRVASVLTPENQSEWIGKASRLSHRLLEKEIAQVRPQERTPERASYVSGTRVRLELGLSEKAMIRLRKAQDLVSQKLRYAASLEATIEALTGEYLERHDPVRKAVRHQVRKGSASKESKESKESTQTVSRLERDLESKSERPDQSQSKPLPLTLRHDKAHSIRETASELVARRVPSAIQHQVHLRDRRRCTEFLPDGTRCNETRWIEIHHRLPFSRGGPHTLENLTTLCSAHHRRAHFEQVEQSANVATRAE